MNNYEPSTSTQKLIPGTPAYEKARKSYMKSNKNRTAGDTHDWSAFRVAEKQYKAKFPPPDLSDVLDLALLDAERQKEISDGVWKGSSDALEVNQIRLMLRPPVNGEQIGPTVRAFTVRCIPGLVVLPGYLSPKLQRDLVRWSLSEHARPPNITNLDAHYSVPHEGVWKAFLDTRPGCQPFREEQLHRPQETGTSQNSQEVRLPRNASPSRSNSITDNIGLSRAEYRSKSSSVSLDHAAAADLLSKLRWANIGWFYNWGTKEYDFNLGKVEVGEPVKPICKKIVELIDWSEVFEERNNVDQKERQSADATDSSWREWVDNYEPDAGIVNFYGHKDTMMGHVDRSEICATSPLVSLSLGNAAVFLIGGLTREEKPVALLLRSGDAIVMAGAQCRRVYHGVPRILDGTLPQHLQVLSEQADDWTEFGRYLQTKRININVRQVFPKDFKPH